MLPRSSAIRWAVRVSLISLVLLAGCAPPPEYYAPSAFGLRPLQPPPADRYGPSTVNSLQPVLRWEEFPRRQERVADSEGVVNRIRRVTYELRIWKKRGTVFRPGGDFAGDSVYTRKDLMTTTHQIKVTLEPGARYLWTVRARYLLDGKPRVTDWGQQVKWHLPRGRENKEDVFYGYYEFSTPFLPSAGGK